MSRTSVIPTPILQRGHHRHPRNGACLMEFAATLPGGPWADNPVHVQPALTALARRVNDHTSDDGRPALLPWAAWLVGTAGEHDLDGALAVRATALRHADPALAALAWPATARATRRLIRLAVATVAGSLHPDEALRALLADAVNATRSTAGLEPVVVDSAGYREWPTTQPIRVELRIPDGSESAFYFCTALPGGWPRALAEAWSARADELRRRTA
ncbi:hypothetical protein [Paractinoplanes toevensis]|uniref:Uncharacterized protein n=1 Tax=Paractinoplanes toevensis TaxID=571911 RepID=A0A920BQQ1_9ACTN|nr:hypothetical protein [Actinoplanes toevensis]GIM97619.1 hypothetical protein Ato02nite_094120 [Actinoplanes toevensis]